MLTEQQIQERVQKLSKAITNTLQELDPKTKHPTGKIHGIAIFLFPTDHYEKGHIICTMMGKICINHLVECALTQQAEVERERVPVA